MFGFLYFSHFDFRYFLFGLRMCVCALSSYPSLEKDSNGVSSDVSAESVFGVCLRVVSFIFVQNQTYKFGEPSRLISVFKVFLILIYTNSNSVCMYVCLCVCVHSDAKMVWHYNRYRGKRMRKRRWRHRQWHQRRRETTLLSNVVTYKEKLIRMTTTMTDDDADVVKEVKTLRRTEWRVEERRNS